MNPETVFLKWGELSQICADLFMARHERSNPLDYLSVAHCQHLIVSVCSLGKVHTLLWRADTSCVPSRLACGEAQLSRAHCLYPRSTGEMQISAPTPRQLTQNLHFYMLAMELIPMFKFGKHLFALFF